MKLGICGSHGTAKSTLAFQLCLDYKKSNPTKTVGLFLENVVHCPLEKNKVATKESELWMFSKQIEEEIYLSTKYDILICDRTVLDPIPYTQYLGFYSLADAMKDISKEYHVGRLLIAWFIPYINVIIALIHLIIALAENENEAINNFFCSCFKIFK